MPYIHDVSAESNFPQYGSGPAPQGGHQPYGQPAGAPGQSGPHHPQYAAPMPGGHHAAAQQAFGRPLGPVGKVRSTGMCFLLVIVTIGFYAPYWFYATHKEMKEHSGEGVGGGVALVLGLFVSLAMAFINSNEVGNLYVRRGQEPPVSAATGCWCLLPLVGAIIWFVKSNSALNDYWTSLGARP